MFLPFNISLNLVKHLKSALYLMHLSEVEMLVFYFILVPVNFVTIPDPGYFLCIHYPTERKFGTTHNVKDQIPQRHT